ncbi:MAG: hypothetical protein K0S74_1841 [Chlamydiales bacterium]|jgi:type II restriction/modification system DNA methylase subunit YeeA|nr:hypothetical protein [Chlamydiales bacterium]
MVYVWGKSVDRVKSKTRNTKEEITIPSSRYVIHAPDDLSSNSPHLSEIRHYIQRWKKSLLNEQQGAQTHFLELCELFSFPKPSPDDETYLFEKQLTKVSGAKGRSDVWKRGHFVWEYKSKGEDLGKALEQLHLYLPALENPPILIACDMERFEIRTNWTNHVTNSYSYTIQDLLKPEFQKLLKAVFENPESLKPSKTTIELTEESVYGFVNLAKSIEIRTQDPLRTAHFLNRFVFCMFAESARLLKDQCFTKTLRSTCERPEQFVPLFSDLFSKMSKGGYFGHSEIDHFNGGLFDNPDVIELQKEELQQLYVTSQNNWKEIDPTIFGTLFERTIDPSKRKQLGAHYTSPEKIAKIVQPVVILPLQYEWDEIKVKVEEFLKKKQKTKAKALYEAFMARLATFTVLDPACGSGNFLYQALKELKSFNHKVILEAQQLGLDNKPLVETLNISPKNVRGIEKEVHAAELARLVIWIGEIQWMIANGFGINRKPILQTLDNIECRDALLNPDGTEAEWPDADAIVGNPPFLGGNKLQGAFDTKYLEALRKIYVPRISGKADLVCYWLEKGQMQLLNQKAQTCGFIATRNIQSGNNRKVLDKFTENLDIYHAYSDEEWDNEGASIRVAMLCLKNKVLELPKTLDCKAVKKINTDLKDSINLSQAFTLEQNLKLSFQGIIKLGPFDIPGNLAREWLKMPNGSGKPNKDVLKPLLNGQELVQIRPQDRWIIDFNAMSIEEAMQYELPFAYVKEHVKPIRDKNNRWRRKELWWLHGELNLGMRQALQGLKRYLVTSIVAKHRIFTWLSINILPDARLIVFSKEDDFFLGILQSTIHKLWSLKVGNRIGVGGDPVYNNTKCFETFPFPQGLTPDIPAEQYTKDPRAVKIAKAAKELYEWRENWLNPKEWMNTVPEIIEGYPDRILPKDDGCAKALKQRTLTNLYNQMPDMLKYLHKQLDDAVAEAYGWPTDLSDEEILQRLFDLNQARS